MAWDFSTEPEFEKKLEWMREFVREEVFPLEVLETDEATFMRIVRSLQDEVRKQGLWAAHLPPEHGGQGFGQVKLGLMHEIDGMSTWAPLVFGNQAPDSGNSEVLAMFGTPEQKERWLRPLLDGRIRSGFSMTEPMHAGADPVNGPYERASMFLVPTDTPGVNRLRNIPTMAGGHEHMGQGHSEIKYENVRIPADAIIGRRGEAFRI